jgi:hypothetical protein
MFSEGPNMLKITTVFLFCFVLTASDSGPSGAGPKIKSEPKKEERANAKLPPCGSCVNLVTSFEQVK